MHLYPLCKLWDPGFDMSSGQITKPTAPKCVSEKENCEKKRQHQKLLLNNFYFKGNSQLIICVIKTIQYKSLFISFPNLPF